MFGVPGWAAGLSLLVGCGDAGSEATDDYGGRDTASGSDDSDDTQVETDQEPSDTSGASENEDDRLLLRPAQSDVHIFIANPSRNTVSRVNVLTQEVRTLKVGQGPRTVRITEDYATAAVFNAGDDTVSLVDALALTQVVVPVRDNLNAMALSPGGGHLVLWHDVDAPDEGFPVSPTASFHEMSIIDVDAKTHRPLVIGFSPKDVAFTRDGTLALAVADASVALVHLDDPSARPEVIAIADPLDAPVAEEIVLDPAGRFAIVRQRGVDALVVVDLDTRAVTTVPVGTDPTDVDLLPDASGVVIVSRGAKEVSLLLFADPTAPERVIAFPDNTPLGSVLLGPTNTAVLYTNAALVDRYATWDLLTDEITLRPLVKPVASVSRTPTGGSLLVVHTVDDNPDGTTPAPYRGKRAVSLVDLEDFRANTITLGAAVEGLANSSDGTLGFLIQKGRPELAVLDYRTLIFDTVPLRSAPVFVGVLPDLDAGDNDEPPAWVSQEHPLGRLSFYDADDGEVRTITGFELNAAIEVAP